MERIKYLPIPTPRDFWKAVALFAYRRWAGVGSSVKPVGIPGNRDPEHPCTAYEPLPRSMDAWGNCPGDGHYLCSECCHFEPVVEQTNEEWEQERGEV